MGAIAYIHPDRAVHHVDHWLHEIQVFRSNIIDTLDESPGLKGQLEELCATQWRKSREMTVQKVRQVGELPSAGECEVRESMGNVTSPTANEILGFDWQLHKQNSTNDISDYFNEDPDAPRYPVFLRNALRRIRERAHGEGLTRD